MSRYHSPLTHKRTEFPLSLEDFKPTKVKFGTVTSINVGFARNIDYEGSSELLTLEFTGYFYRRGGGDISLRPNLDFLLKCNEWDRINHCTTFGQYVPLAAGHDDLISVIPYPSAQRDIAKLADRTKVDIVIGFPYMYIHHDNKQCGLRCRLVSVKACDKDKSLTCANSAKEIAQFMHNLPCIQFFAIVLLDLLSQFMDSPIEIIA